MKKEITRLSEYVITFHSNKFGSYKNIRTGKTGTFTYLCSKEEVICKFADREKYGE